MNKSTLRSPAILVLTGASGAGKTTLTLKLNELAIPGVKGLNCDRVKVESDETADPSDRKLSPDGMVTTFANNAGAQKTTQQSGSKSKCFGTPHWAAQQETPTNSKKRQSKRVALKRESDRSRRATKVSV